MREIHGKSKSPEYKIWSMMKDRCTNPKNKDFYLYGGRGISFHPSWSSFNAFYMHVGSRPEGCTLDRLDPDKDYEPGNTRWATRKEQALNQREGDGTRGKGNRRITFNGETKTISEWAEKVGIHISSLRDRLESNLWTLEEALTLQNTKDRSPKHCKRVLFNGQQLSVRELSKHSGIGTNIIAKRIQAGWEIDKVINTPVRLKIHKNKV